VSKRRKLLIYLCVGITCLSATALFFGASKKKHSPSPVTEKADFETLMGKGLSSWEYVQTQEDFANLEFFKQVFQKNLASIFKEQNLRIPKVVHFIWLGPNPFPRESVENVRSWMGKHPDWTFKFWSDRIRPVPVPGMELKLIKDFSFLQLKECFNKSDNYGEKSDVLRYEILYQEGGVYADHDVKCLKNFDQFNQTYDFYCGMDMPYKSSLPSCVFPTNNLIGISPKHPILKTCMDSLKAQWDQIEMNYPGTARDEVLNRVLHRTFLLFGEAIKTAQNQGNRRDIVFPAFYFDAPKEEQSLFAHHLYSGKWFEEETKFEKMVRERLMTITKKTNKLFLILGSMTVLNLLGFCALLFYHKKKKNLITGY
jgi:hypothetical protein